MDVEEIIEQALEPLGGEHTSGVDASKARRALNLVLIQLQNKNIPLHKIDFLDQALTTDDPDYLLSASVVDILECNIEDSDEDRSIPISRIGLKEYQKQPIKDQSGRPQYFVTERNTAGVTVTFWPVPEDGTYTAKMLVTKRIEDVTASYQRVDLPYRYYPLLVKWLSYELSLTKQGIPDTLRDRLKREYLEAMPDTFEEDRERVDFIFTPYIPSGR